MRRYRPFSRRRLQGDFRSWTKRNWQLILLMTLGSLALIAIETVVLVGLGDRSAVRWYLLGMVHALVAASLVGALVAAFVAFNRSALWQVRGAWGEENTRDELKRAERKRIIWDSVDSLTLQTGDIDHLVVTREGGLVAIDSKWRNQVDSADRDAMAASARRAGVRAEGVVRSIVRSSEASDNGCSVRVRPVVVVWGAARGDIPFGAVVNGVDFVGGRNLVQWLRTVEGTRVTRADAKDLVRRLEALRASAWATSARSS